MVLAALTGGTVPAEPGRRGGAAGRCHERREEGRVPGNPVAAPAGRAGRAAAVLSLRHAAKSFGAVRAVVDGSADLYPGEAHALLGENGAGKSTVVKMLAGVYQPDEGELLMDGAPVTLHSPAAARDAGIAVIYQEPTLFPDLTVAENIFMGRQPLRAGRRIDRRQMRAEAAALFERLGVRLDPGRICRGLSIADQQIVEIAKALSLDARVIVMDEPTAALSALTADDLIRAMVGRQVSPRTAASPHEPGEEVLRVDRLTREGVFTDVSLRVRAGEIVVLAGLVGSGRSEVARAIFGIDRYDAGAVTLAGRPLRRAAPAAAMAAGVGFVPEDRRQQGLVMDMSVQQNMALASLGRLRTAGLVRSAAERAFAADWAQRLRLKYGRLTDPVSRLSGGNQQKVVLAKWLGRRPALLIVDEPTRGIDIATKAEVHALLARLAADGVAILMISSELPEVLQNGDRILVMREGRLTAEYRHEDASEEKIMAAATGQTEAEAS